MKYLILLVGLYLIHRYRVLQRNQMNAGQKQSPIDDRSTKNSAVDDEADYIDYEEME
jgi:hypothetical protein